jgi:thymidylate kinase
MKEMEADHPVRQGSPLIIELVGLAGAGKTTLLHALSRRSEEIQIGAEIELRKLRHVPVFVRNAPSLLPIILHPGQQGRWFTWEEIKYLVYLEAWPQVLEQQAAHAGGVILLDHGPVFKLATLDAFGPDYLKTERSEAWWNAMFKQWASTVDLVIWLDAPDPILEKRINSRSQRHAVKGKTETEALHFLGRYRMAYEKILARLMIDAGPVLFQFDTGQTTIEQVVDEVLLTVASHLEGARRTVASLEVQTTIVR